MKKFLRKFFPLLSCVALLASMLIPVSAATVYTVRYDGNIIISYSSTSSSVSLTLVVTSSGFKISVDGAQEDHQYTGTENNISTRHFGGLNLDGSSDSLTYSPGNNYSITLDSSHFILDLYSVYLYPLYIDPNGGTWNGSSSTSVFWELPNTDTDEIYDPVRAGYTFTGWSFSGSGEFNNFGDPPYNYEHGQGAGYLTANWSGGSSDPQLYTTLVKVYNSSGTSLLTTFNASDYSTSPDASLIVADSFLAFLAPSVDVETVWDYSGDRSIAGISLTANSTSPTYTPGDTLSFLGLPGQSSVTSLYLIEGEELSSSVLKAGQWKCNYAVMTGEFIDLTAWPDVLSSVDLDFVSNNTSYASMKYQYDVYSGHCLYYDDTLAYKYDTISADPSPAWRMSAFALVYFESDQTVSQEFYDWFTSCFTYVGVDQTQPTYTSTINIYDSSGTQLLSTYSASASGVAPVISLTVQDDGCILVYGDQTHTWSAGDADFYGFNVSPNVSLAYYSPGHAYRLPGGESADLVMDLYCVDEEPVSALPAVDFVSWLVAAVGGFLSFEFIPGFSLDRILIFCFLFGLLFWFLKISK